MASVGRRHLVAWSLAACLSSPRLVSLLARRRSLQVSESLTCTPQLTGGALPPNYSLSSPLWAGQQVHAEKSTYTNRYERGTCKRMQNISYFHLIRVLDMFQVSLECPTCNLRTPWVGHTRLQTLPVCLRDNPEIRCHVVNLPRHARASLSMLALHASPRFT